MQRACLPVVVMSGHGTSLRVALAPRQRSSTHATDQLSCAVAAGADEADRARGSASCRPIGRVAGSGIWLKSRVLGPVERLRASPFFDWRVVRPQRAASRRQSRRIGSLPAQGQLRPPARNREGLLEALSSASAVWPRTCLRPPARNPTRPRLRKPSGWEITMYAARTTALSAAALTLVLSSPAFATDPEDEWPSPRSTGRLGHGSSSSSGVWVHSRCEIPRSSESSARRPWRARPGRSSPA